MKKAEKQNKKDKAGKNELSQQEIAAGITTFALPHSSPDTPVLETADGKVNGAKPKAYKGQQSSHP